MTSQESKPAPHCYFVDEAGDATLFGKRGRIIVGSGGCSRFFILGALEVPDTERLLREMEELRQRLVSDPYFKDVPSMQPQARKTALAFHATDDLPEVRREVFQLLVRQDLRFFAVIRDKLKVIDYVHQRNEREPGYRYNPNELYDYLVRSLFKERLHLHYAYQIHFAKRGKSDRTEALRSALNMARERFLSKKGISRAVSLEVTGEAARESPTLQAVDYFLWSLQRLCEVREDRYVQLLWPAFHLVRDLDDVSAARYGLYYTQKNPLSAAAFANRPGI